MKDNPSEELKKLEQQLLAAEEEPEEVFPEAEAEDDDALIIPEEDEPEAETAQEPFVERDEEFEAFYQDILKEFGPETKPRKMTAATRKTAYSDPEPRKPKKEKGVKGLVITLCLEMLGIAGIVLWWIFRIL